MFEGVTSSAERLSFAQLSMVFKLRAWVCERATAFANAAVRVSHACCVLQSATAGAGPVGNQQGEHGQPRKILILLRCACVGQHA